jgi:predicted nucleic acid-binding protein
LAALFWDASALVKRYFLEAGSETVDALFDATPSQEMATTPWSYAETYSVLLRRFNGGVLDLSSFAAAVTALQNEVAGNPDFGLVSISDEAVFASIAVMRQHNLNATDAAILVTCHDFARLRQANAVPAVLIAADQRLLRAALAEGLATLNPEQLAAHEVPAFLARL